MVKNALSAAVILSMFHLLPAWSRGSYVHFSETQQTVSLSNDLIRFSFDRQQGRYRILDLRTNMVCLEDAHVELNDWRSDGVDATHTAILRNVYDGLGKGRGLLIESHLPKGPVLLLDVIIYEGCGFVCLGTGMVNTTKDPIQLRRLVPLTGATIYPRQALMDVSLLDGNGGGENTSVTRGDYLSCRNNGLLTFQLNHQRRSLVLGGLTYHDYEKFVHIGWSRAEKLQRSLGHDGCVTYLDLGVATTASSGDGLNLRLLQGRPFSFESADDGRYPSELKSVVFDEKEVVIEASGLTPSRGYRVSFTWWDVDNNGRVQSVWLENTNGQRVRLLEKQALPAWRGKQQGPVEIDVSLPASVLDSDTVRLVFVNEASVPNAVVGEIWLGAIEDDRPVRQQTVTLAKNESVEALPVRLFAEDPIGRRVDAGVRYLPEDRFYVDVATDDPFKALEIYGQQVRKAQAINLTVYDFPTVCLWYGEIAGYGGGPAANHSVGAVEEMQRIADSGFLEYSRAAVRLVPDLYEPNNQQGWWDNEHFVVNQPPTYGNGRYLPPYETTEKWAGAVRELGGLPLTYCQTGFRSEDYARTYPEHMLFNQAVRFHQNVQPCELDGLNAWQLNSRVWGYDYTDPGFMAHMRDVYDNLRRGGVQGLMFDYAYTGWAFEGGFEDPWPAPILCTSCYESRG